MSIRNCTEFERRLDEAAELRLSPRAAELEPHMSQCEACRLLWEQSVELDRAIAAWKKTDAAALGADDLVRPAARGTRPALTRRGWQVALAAAAAALVFALVLPNAFFGQPDRSVAATGPQMNSGIPTAQQDDSDLELLVQDAGSAYLALAADMSGAASAAELLMPSQGDFGGDASSEAGPPAWLEGWPEQLSPIQRRVSEAFDFLQRTLPAEQAPTSTRAGQSDDPVASVRGDAHRQVS